MPGKDRTSAVPAMAPQDLYRSNTPTPPSRPSSAPPPEHRHTPSPPLRVTTSVEMRSFTRRPKTARPGSARGSSAKGPVKPLAAGNGEVDHSL